MAAVSFPTNAGYCPVCRREATFIETGHWLRDTYFCEYCRTCPRQRALVRVLDLVRPSWRNASIHESSPSLFYFGAQCAGYSYSFFFEDVPLGQTREGVRCEDVERLTFADESFDVFITQDVLEHVWKPAKACREILRVLRPGGFHIFTTPKHKQLLRSFPRAELQGDQVVHLHEAQYHGSPIADGRCLVTWDYGIDFDDLLREWTGCPVSDYVIRDRSMGIDGEFLDVFVMAKK